MFAFDINSTINKALGALHSCGHTPTNGLVDKVTKRLAESQHPSHNNGSNGNHDTKTVLYSPSGWYELQPASLQLIIND